MSDSLLPGIIRAAIVSVNSVIAAWTTWTLVPKSVAIGVIATFVLVPAKLHRNWARTNENRAGRMDGDRTSADSGALALARGAELPGTAT